MRPGTDASDLMPPEIGGVIDGEPDAFFQGMIDWVDGTRTIEEIFADSDSKWETLDDDVVAPGP